MELRNFPVKFRRIRPSCGRSFRPIYSNEVERKGVEEVAYASMIRKTVWLHLAHSGQPQLSGAEWRVGRGLRFTKCIRQWTGRKGRHKPALPNTKKSKKNVKCQVTRWRGDSLATCRKIVSPTPDRQGQRSTWRKSTRQLAKDSDPTHQSSKSGHKRWAEGMISTVSSVNKRQKRGDWPPFSVLS